jgi:hypothetical protein
MGDDAAGVTTAMATAAVGEAVQGLVLEDTDDLDVSVHIYAAQSDVDVLVVRRPQLRLVRDNVLAVMALLQVVSAFHRLARGVVQRRKRRRPREWRKISLV